MKMIGLLRPAVVVGAAAALLAFGAPSTSAGASLASTGTLTVTGQIVGSISLTIESAGGLTTGTGTAAVSTDLGALSKFGAPPSGFELTRSGSAWTLSSSVGVRVVKSNFTSSDYTLQAQLGTFAENGVAWALNGSTLSEAAATTLTTTGLYGSTGSYTWQIVVEDYADAGNMDNTIEFLATAN